MLNGLQSVACWVVLVACVSTSSICQGNAILACREVNALTLGLQRTLGKFILPKDLPPSRDVEVYMALKNDRMFRKGVLADQEVLFVEKTYPREAYDGNDLAYQIPSLRLKRANDVAHMFENDLERIFKSYVDRRGMPPEFIESLRNEERNLPRINSVNFRKRISATNEEAAELVRLFDGSNTQVPLERKLKKQISARSSGVAVLELGRAYRSLDVPKPRGELSFREIFVEIGTYLERFYLSQGLDAVVVARVNLEGKGIWERYGFKEIENPETLRAFYASTGALPEGYSSVEELAKLDEYVLEMKATDWIMTYGSRYEMWRAYWHNRYPTQNRELYPGFRKFMIEMFNEYNPETNSRPPGQVYSMNSPNGFLQDEPSYNPDDMKHYCKQGAQACLQFLFQLSRWSRMVVERDWRVSDNASTALQSFLLSF
jgi:hypothetical protein